MKLSISLFGQARYPSFCNALYPVTVCFARNTDSFETAERGLAKQDRKLKDRISILGFYADAIVFVIVITMNRSKAPV